MGAENKKHLIPLPVVSFREAKKRGLVSISQMKKKKLQAKSPVAVVLTSKGRLFLYDPSTATPKQAESAARTQAPCLQCGAMTYMLDRICRKCRAKNRIHQIFSDYFDEKEKAKTKDLSKMVFLDLEMTGDARADEILSVSMTDGNGKVLLDTLIHPLKAKKWPFTVKIHHITPPMVEHSPTIRDVEQKIYQILSDAEEVLGYSISNDWSHLMCLPLLQENKEKFEGKVRCCQKFYECFITQDRPDLDNGKRSLDTAMSMLDLTWSGRQHSSLADTIACANVWKRMFLQPNLIPIRVVQEEPKEDNKETLEEKTE